MNLNHVTLILKPDLDILKMYRYAKSKVKFLGQGFQKLEHEQDRHTDRHDWNYNRATFTGGKNCGQVHG